MKTMKTAAKKAAYAAAEEQARYDAAGIPEGHRIAVAVMNGSGTEIIREAGVINGMLGCGHTIGHYVRRRLSRPYRLIERGWISRPGQVAAILADGREVVTGADAGSGTGSYTVDGVEYASPMAAAIALTPAE